MPEPVDSKIMEARLKRLAHEALERARTESQLNFPQSLVRPPAPHMRSVNTCRVHSNSPCASGNEGECTRTERGGILAPNQPTGNWKDVALARATPRGIQSADYSCFMEHGASREVTLAACSSADTDRPQRSEPLGVRNNSFAGPKTFHGLDKLTTRGESNGEHGDMKIHIPPPARTIDRNQRRGGAVPFAGVKKRTSHRSVEPDTHPMPPKTPAGSSDSTGNCAEANDRQLPPASWNISEGRYQSLVDFMRRYMPSHSPEILSPAMRAQIFELIDGGKIPDTPSYKKVNPERAGTIQPSQVNGEMKALPKGATKEQKKAPVITSKITFHDELAESGKQRTQEQIREISRVAMEFAANKLSRGEPSGQFIVKEVEECCDHPKGTVKRPKGNNIFISSDGRKFEVSEPPNDIAASTPTNPTSTMSDMIDKPVTRSNRKKGRSRAKRNGNAHSQPKPPTQSPLKPATDKNEKMAPNASKMVDESDKSKSLDAYMKRYKSIPSQQAQARAKKEEASQIDQAIDQEDEDPGQCTNPRCKCNQKSQNRGSSTNTYQKPASSNAAEYGSGSEVSSREPFKVTFEEALLSTCSFSQRVKISASNDRDENSNIEGDGLVAKVQNLGLGEAPCKEEIGGEGSEVEKVLAKAVGLSVEHYRQSTISSSLKERERLIRAMRELTGDEKPPPKKQVRPKREEVGECGTTNADIYSGLRAMVAEQFRPPARNADDQHGGLTLPVFLLPGVLDLAMRRQNEAAMRGQNEAAPPKRRRRRAQYKTVVHPIPEDLKNEIGHWEFEFREMGIPDEQYMSWMIDRYSSYCKGLEKLQKLVTDMTEGPPSPQIDHILKVAQGATGVAADKYILKSNAEGSSSR